MNEQTDCKRCKYLFYICSENIWICEHDDIKDEVDDITNCKYFDNVMTIDEVKHG